MDTIEVLAITQGLMHGKSISPCWSLFFFLYSDFDYPVTQDFMLADFWQLERQNYSPILVIVFLYCDFEPPSFFLHFQLLITADLHFGYNYHNSNIFSHSSHYNFTTVTHRPCMLIIHTAVNCDVSLYKSVYKFIVLLLPPPPPPHCSVLCES